MSRMQERMEKRELLKGMSDEEVLNAMLEAKESLKDLLDRERSLGISHEAHRLECEEDYELSRAEVLRRMAK